MQRPRIDDVADGLLCRHSVQLSIISEGLQRDIHQCCEVRKICMLTKGEITEVPELTLEELNSRDAPEVTSSHGMPMRMIFSYDMT
jgi:hypothetical protein